MSKCFACGHELLPGLFKYFDQDRPEDFYCSGCAGKYLDSFKTMREVVTKDTEDEQVFRDIPRAAGNKRLEREAQRPVMFTKFTDPRKTNDDRVDTTYPQIMQYFRYGHLPDHLQEFSRPFHELAKFVVVNTPCCAERSVALRKLLEAKDAAVRAAL